MIVRTEIKEQPNGDIFTVEYDENDVPVKFCTEIKKGGRIRCEIMNPERWHTTVDNLYKYFINKRKMQSDESMKVYEDYKERKLAELTAKKKQKV